MVGWEVESVGKISEIICLVAVVIGEISVIICWVPRYVETLETIRLEAFGVASEIVGLKARVCDGVTDMMALETFC